MFNPKKFNKSQIFFRLYVPKTILFYPFQLLKVVFEFLIIQFKRNKNKISFTLGCRGIYGGARRKCS